MTGLGLSLSSLIAGCRSQLCAHAVWLKSCVILRAASSIKSRHVLALHNPSQRIRIETLVCSTRHTQQSADQPTSKDKCEHKQCRCGNVVNEEGSTESVAVTVAVLDTEGQSAVDSSVVNIGINSSQIPRADGQVTLDSISVKTARAGTPARTAHAGNYILEFSISSTTMPPVEPVRWRSR